MLNMREFFDNHQSIGPSAERIANAVDVVPRQIDKHDVLGPIFQTSSKLIGEFEVFFGSTAPLDGTSNRMSDNTVGIGLAFDEKFGRCANEVEVGVGDVK